METCDDCHGTSVMAVEAMLGKFDARVIGCADDSINTPVCMNSYQS